MKALTKRTLVALISAPLILSSGFALANQDTHPNRGKMVDMQHNQKGMHYKGNKKGGHNMARIFKQLNLTEEQKQEMKTLRTAFHEQVKNKPQTKSLKNSPQFYQQALEALMLSENFDEAATRSLLQDQANLHIEKQVEMAKFKHSLFSVLTEEQKAEYKKIKAEKAAEMKAKMEERKEKHEAKKAEREAKKAE